MLRAIDTETGKPVEIGAEIIDHRGDKAILVSLDRVNEMRYGGCRSGKVTGRWYDGMLRSVYDGVFGITVIETNWENSSEGDRQCQ